MTPRPGHMRAVWLLLCVGLFIPGWGCSKRAVSSSGDQAAIADGKQSGMVETIAPDQMATVPESQQPRERGAVDAGRESLSTAPGASAPAESSSSPSGRTFSQGAQSGVPPSGAPGSPSGAPGSPGSAPAFGTAPAGATGMGLADIFFDFDRYAIRSDAQPVLESNAAWLKNSSSKSILIEGHCDERGTQAYNMVLGEKRAKATRQYLQDLGVPASRMKTVSYGEVRPFCHGRDEPCYQLNRRAHFVVQ